MSLEPKITKFHPLSRQSINKDAELKSILTFAYESRLTHFLISQNLVTHNQEWQSES